MARLPHGVRRDPEDAAFAVCFAASLVLAALGWWSAAGVAFVLGIAGAVLIDTLWPEGVGTDGDARAERGDADDATPDALETLRGRYARGEIDEAEFERRLEALLETESVDAARRRVDRERDAAPSVRERDGTAERDRESAERARE